MTNRQDVAFPDRIAWGAVVAGALTALAVHLVLSVFALGLGLGAVDVVTDPDAESGAITAGVGIWWILSAAFSFFLGGWVAGRIAGGPFAPGGVLLGVLVWALVTVASFYVVTTSASTVLGGPIAVATDSVYDVLREAELQTPVDARPVAGLSEEDREDVEEMRSEAARGLAARAEGAMRAGLWAAFTLMLGAGAAIAGTRMATDPPEWARPRPRF